MLKGTSRPQSLCFQEGLLCHFSRVSRTEHRFWTELSGCSFNKIPCFTSNQSSEYLFKHQMPSVNSSLVTNPTKTVLLCSKAHDDLTVHIDIYFIIPELSSQPENIQELLNLYHLSNAPLSIA